MSKSILIFGGDKDFNLLRFLKRLQLQKDVEIVPCIFGESGDPVFNYNLQDENLYLDNRIVDVDGAFVRYDVFNFLETKSEKMRAKSQAFYTSFLAWLNLNDKVKVLNKEYFRSIRTNKVRALILAKKAGFLIPETYVSNDLLDLDRKLDDKAYIYKDVEGGSFTEELTREKINIEKRSKADFPFFMQEKLVQPELRVFRVGDEYFSFNMQTKSLDYRENNDVKIISVETPEELKEKVRKVTDSLNLTYSAIDMKTDPQTGELMFLEANSQPMFAAFDEVVDYGITDAMIKYLLD